MRQCALLTEVLTPRILRLVRLDSLYFNFMPYLSNFMPNLSASPQRGGAGLGLRGVARILLVSWLFTLAVCFYSDFHRTSADVVKNAPLAHAHKGTTNDSDAPHEDACCTVLENLSVFSHANNIQIPLHNLVYILLPGIIVLQAVLLVPLKILFISTGPPGKSHHALIANSLWPNAPPR